MSTPSELDPLPLTGERTVPGVARENYWFRRHEAVYQMLSPAGNELCAAKVVLEAGSGEGYGANLLAQHAETVFALDYDQQAIAHTCAKYPQVAAVRGNLAALPFQSGSIDVIVNLQVIEHLWDQIGFLRECHRVLRENGTLVVSTPNRITFSPGRRTPLNPFHTKEFAPKELWDLMVEAGFARTSMTGLYHGARLAELDSKHPGGLIGAQTELAISGQAWPEALRDAVSSVTTKDFVFETRAYETVGELDTSLDLIAFGAKA
ncbi:Methyltransferase type 11 [Segniliparus rotundus DSM 44985]|uniref:Methyltransferase type 11 n=2 Tax=Segniliparus rotundus TaxID=286802 RepID=D6Z7D6_SEGRD|nr:class I SAM-dependent methyltransferase [Segniliparus rotundus]ADG97866.1 Methyltransferase type 11 [Segniliparus rotundus DSM 44985]